MTIELYWHASHVYLWGWMAPSSSHANGRSATHAELASLLNEPADESSTQHHEPAESSPVESAGDAIAPATHEPGAGFMTEIELWLPANESGVLFGPLPASEQGAALPHLQKQVLTALRLDALKALTVLKGIGAASSAPAASNAYSVGTTASYFQRVAAYVLDALATGQFYPDLEHRRGDCFTAVWRLANQTHQTEVLDQLVTLLPPLMRVGVQSAPPPTPADLLEAIVKDLTDRLIRRFASEDDFFSRVHDLASKALASSDVRWLSALLADDPVFPGHPNAAHDAYQLVRQWSGRLEERSSTAPWRMVITLEEPPMADPGDPDDPTSSLSSDDQALTDGADLSWKLILQLQAPSDADAAAHTARIGNADAFADESSAPATDQSAAVANRIESDDGLIVDAKELWEETSESGGLFGRAISDRRAQFMNELRKAAGVCPVLARVMDQPAPQELDISTAEAHLFIRQWSQDLLNVGIGVRLPDFTTGGSESLGLLLSVRPGSESADSLLDSPSGNRREGAPYLEPESGVSGGRFGLESLLNFDWQIAVGDLRVQVEEFRSLIEKASPLLRYRGKWMQINKEAALKAIAFLEKQKQGPQSQLTLAQALRAAYGANPADTGLPVLGLSGSHWIDELLKQSPSIAVEEAKQPEGFLGELRPYQLKGLQWLQFLDRLGLGGCLADDMGLGKTIQLIGLLLVERIPPKGSTTPRTPGPTLLFAPTSVVGNWVRELSRFAPSLKVAIHHGPQRPTGQTFIDLANKSDVVLTSYALAHRDVETLKQVNWWRVALDEAQKIKNSSAAAAQAIRSIPAAKRVALTGTPIENHLSELWSIMDLLNPGLLGTAADFRERFAQPVERAGDKAKAQQLRQLIKPFVLRRIKTDPQVAGDLPEKMEMKVYCNLTGEQAAVYERITAEMLGQIDSATGIRRRGLILAALTRLKQVCDHPILLAGAHGTDPTRLTLDKRSGKCERLAEMLEELLEEGDAALIFTQYREMGHLLERLIAERIGAPTLFLHGGTPARMRDSMIDEFQAPGSNKRVFILSLRAGGLGLNLTAANHVFHFDRWWNPAVEQQATDRAHRIGQKRKVQVHQFVCVGTLEERIDKLLTDKLQLADRIVGSGDDWLTDMSTDQLRQYLSLADDAVAEY